MFNKNGRWPDFLCIGAQKAGTTWLHSNLQQHSEIWLPQRKELHYFDYQFPPFQPYPEKIIYKDQQETKIFGDRIVARVRRAVSSIKKIPNYNLARVNWELQYRFVRQNDQWYKKLFRPAGEFVTGDFTPAYSILSKEAVEYVHQRIPNGKIIFLMRNPIERSWSHAKMMLGNHNHRELSEINYQEFIEHMQSEPSRLRSSYLYTLSNWENMFGSKQMLVLFFDDIITDPAALLRKVYKFLELTETTEHLPESVTQRVHGGQRGDMPSAVREMLFKQYETELRELALKYGGAAAQWLSDAEKNSFTYQAKAKEII